MSRLRIVFPKPGFFLADTMVQLTVDGAPVHQGSFQGGFEVELEVEPGVRILEARIAIPPLSRNRRWEVQVAPAELVTIELAYSRWWGNFTNSPDITRAAFRY